MVKKLFNKYVLSLTIIWQFIWLVSIVVAWSRFPLYFKIIDCVLLSINIFMLYKTHKAKKQKILLEIELMLDYGNNTGS